MGRISDDVKNRTFSPVYLIYGEEAYLKDNYRKSLIKALVSPGDNLNYSFFSGGGTDPGEVLSLAQTLPFMAEKRVVQVIDSGFFKKSDDDIVDYLEKPSPDTVLLFVESEVDKRGRAFKAASKAGYVVEAAKYDAKKLPQWVAAGFKRYEKKVKRETVDLLIDRVGTDMTALDMEIAKLSSYAGDRDIVTSEDVTELVSRSPAFNVFQMIDAIADRRLNRAVGIYYDMLAEKESPFGILALMERHYRGLLVVKDMNERKADPAEIAKGAGIPAFAVSKYGTQARKYSRGRLIKVLDSCVKADRDIKQGNMDPGIAVELLIVDTASE
ncbi:MAG: DNA polymerase III subunit delta [Lachnospiraceae bacterium]|nr:DNA polymerase III subunit delta [Lachnospiraceae bacterium]